MIAGRSLFNHRLLAPDFFIDIGEHVFKLAVEHLVQALEPAVGDGMAPWSSASRSTTSLLLDLLADPASASALRLRPRAASAHNRRMAVPTRSSIGTSGSPIAAWRMKPMIEAAISSFFASAHARRRFASV